MTEKAKKKAKSKAQSRLAKSKDATMSAKKSAKKSTKKSTAKKAAKSTAKSTAKTVKVKSAKKKSVLGDDPLQWMKDALDENTNELSANHDAMPSAYETEPSIDAAQEFDSASSLEMKKMADEQLADEDQPGSVSVVEQSQLVEEEVQSESEKTVNDGTVNLGSRLVISTVKEVKMSLDDTLELEGDVVLDAGQLEDVDTAGVQLLFAFKLELARQKRSLEFSTIAGKLKDVAEIMSVSESLFDTR